MKNNQTILKFPKGFLWGTATSSHQVEGGLRNNWTEWEKEGHIEDGTVSGKACNSYELYEKDADLSVELNNNAYRFSVEWSRIEPQEGKFNQKEIEHYKKVIKALKKRGIEPLVTIYHWTYPLWFRDKGCWLNSKSPQYFNRYVQYLVKNLDHEVKYWCTINEPLIFAFNSYHRRKWPPQKGSFLKARRVVLNLIKAHKLAYKTIKKVRPDAQIGIAKNNQHFEAFRSCMDRAAVKFTDWYWNHWVLDDLKGYQDYIGLNYYFHNIFQFAPLRPKSLFVRHKNKNEIISDMGWEVYPEGIYHCLMDLHKTYNLPVFILENGIADQGDVKRQAFIKNHLKYVHQAIKEGADVKGYFHWSLIDNFEWKDGFDKKFGLYEVDYNTFERKPRQSAKIYSEICKNNSLIL